MHSYMKLAFCFVLGASMSGISCSRQAARVQLDKASILPVARQYRQSDQRDRMVLAKLQVERPVSSSPNADDEDLYIGQIRSYFKQENFDELEKAAHQARVDKSRFVGGVWKLYGFYSAVSASPEGEPATEAAWTARLATLEKWAAQRPDSVTARVALAEAYVNYAWVARGSGYASAVTEEGWKLFRERAALAMSKLVEAAQLPEKCPYWYEAVQHVAMAAGLEKSQARELMEQAALFEPGYYHYYREYAHFLDPRWYGEPGEAEAFADEIANRVGGQQGDFLYFEIASLLTCQCSADPTHMNTLSWPRIQKGYAALHELYGVSSLKRNRFGYMAYLAADRTVAREVLIEIGDNWDKGIWGNKGRFEAISAWAIGPRDSGHAIDYVSATPARGTEFTVGDHVSLRVTVKYDLAAADSGSVVLVLQKDDISPVSTRHSQVQAPVSRGAGEATLIDEFDVPVGTKMIHAFVRLVPAGATYATAALGFDYPVSSQ